MYFIGDAVCKLGLAYSFARIVRERSYLWFIGLDLFTDFAVSNILDELFFDPRAFQLNEYIAALLALLIVGLRILKYVRENNQHLWTKRFLFFERVIFRATMTKLLWKSRK